MPTGSVSFDPYQVPYDRKAAAFFVFRYDRKAAQSDRFAFLPNIVCEGIHQREGAEPGSADFRYVFDPILGVPSAPTRTEHAYPLDARGPYVVHHDERLCVGRLRADGSLQLVFDGFAQVPQANLSPDSELVAFQSLGTPVREWDTPIGGAIYRGAADPSDPAGDVTTDLPARFNEDLHPNATAEDEDSGEDPDTYPVFLDWRACRARGIGRAFTLGMAARYLMAEGNPAEEYVENPPFFAPGVFLPDEVIPVLENTLSAIVPIPAGGVIDWSDLGTFSIDPILAPDYDATGQAWPAAVEDLTAPHGFGMAFRLSAKDGEPYWQLEIYRKDQPRRLKTLLMQEVGAVLDPGRSNVSGVRLQRDAKDLANEWFADTHPVRYEANFVLAPAFEPDPADALPGGDNKTKPEFVEGKPTFNPIKYRLWVFDEAGDGHWNPQTDAFVDGEATSLDTVLGEGTYAIRRRPGIATLVTMDAAENAVAAGAVKDKRFKAQLWVSKDYAGPIPGVWDNSGSWQQVTSGGWKPLEDRLGIELTMKDPRDWNIGERTGDDAPFPSGKVKVIDAATGGDPVGDNPIVFRLLCVIEGDQDLQARAEKRAASPTKYVVARRDDARDRFRKEIVHKSSHLNPTGKELVIRDDTDKAQAHAEARRRAHEAARFAGSVTIPRFTTAYRIGDRIRAIDGRGIDLRTNIGSDQGESPEYPAVVGIDWSLSEAGQSTTLILADRRAEAALASRTL